MTDISNSLRRSVVGISAAVLIALVASSSPLIQRDAHAGAAGTAAANAAAGGTDACSSNTGTALNGCIANVLDRLAGQLGGDTGRTAGALRTAASQLRAATTKAQALSAISQCRSAISGALRQVRAIGGGHVAGWGGGEGKGALLEAIVGVLSRAASLIQRKG